MAASEDDPFDDDPNETQWAQRRVPGRTYPATPFTIKRENSSDFGQPARFICKVFDNDVESTATFDGTEWVIKDSPAGRVQFKLLVAREAGNVKELWIQRVPAAGFNSVTKTLLNLKAPDVRVLLDFFKLVENMPIEGGPTTRIDDSLIREVLEDPNALNRAYRRDSSSFREMIENDQNAQDVIALERRRTQVKLFHQYMEDDAFFDQAVAQSSGKKPEAVWQEFFEANKWILGITLSTTLLTSFDPSKLERVVAGQSVAGPGKRVDALLETAGRISSLVFAEFKTHSTRLLTNSEYRSGCWSPSSEVAGGVAQVHGTVHEAVKHFGDRLNKRDADGTEQLGQYGYALRPKSFLIVGSLDQFVGEGGGHHPGKIQSFELYRRQLQEPEVITYDELLARADWMASSYS